MVINATTGRILTEIRKTDIRIHPGSTVKPFIAAALVDAGATAAIRCTGTLRIGSRKLDCTHPGIAEPVELPVALAYSCNSYFTSAAMRLKPEQLAGALRRFGFDVAPGDQRPLMAIGEWRVFCTLVELARAYLRLSSSHGPVRDGLVAATDYGTARLARPLGVVVAGKTGTSSRPHRALFAGWAPVESPRIVVAVQTRGGRGGVDAAPIARKLFEEYL